MAPTNIIAVVIMFMILLISRFHIKKSSNKQHGPLPPGPTPFPFIGCIMQMLLNRPTSRWIHDFMDMYNSPIVCIRLGPSVHVIAVSSPELACEFLKKQDEIFISRPETFSASLISGGYRTTGVVPFGNQWKMMRRIISHKLLSSQVHEWLKPKRDEEANHLLMYICYQIQKQNTINIRILSQQFCGNIIRKLIFGKRFLGKGMEDGGPGEEEMEHVSAVLTIIQHHYAFSVNDYFPWLRGRFDLDGHEKVMSTSIEIVRKYQDPIVDERIQMWKKNGDTMKKDDMLDVLINHDDPKLTPQEIKAQILEIMVATIDNPSNAIEWVIWELINQPMLLKKAVEELDHVVGRNRLVEEQDMPKLNYVKACIKESFRLHPFAHFNQPHVSTRDTVVGGYFIPKGSHVLLSRCGLGRNSSVWTDPLRFDPDRHLHGEARQVVLSDDDLTMLSFSTGKRGCPAVVLGSTITTMLLARMLQGFSWEVPCNESSIKLVENHDKLCMAKPLVAIAKPRLPHYLYPKRCIMYVSFTVIDCDEV